MNVGRKGPRSLHGSLAVHHDVLRGGGRLRRGCYRGIRARGGNRERGGQLGTGGVGFGRRRKSMRTRILAFTGMSSRRAGSNPGERGVTGEG